MSKIIPISLRQNYSKLENILSAVLIIDTADELVENDMTMNMLINKVAVKLLYRDDINRLNDMSVSFRTSLMMIIEDIIGSRYQTKDKIVKWFDDEGNFHIATHPHIIGERDKPKINKSLFRDATEYESFVVLKGSQKKLNNNSKDILQLLSSVQYMIRDDISLELLELYSALEYERNKMKVSEPKMQYRERMIQLASETELFRGYRFNNNCKLDASGGRMYPLSRYGHAYQRGDTFQKWLIMPVNGYIVNKEDIKATKLYLKEEFGKRYDYLYEDALNLVNINLAMLSDWKDGYKVKFTATGKELGKACKVISLVENVVNNEGGFTRDMPSIDVTNCGGVQYANQFGDEKFLNVTSLISDVKSDPHQRVADYYDISRADAKNKFVAQNHGARTDGKEEAIDKIFGKSYYGINALAEYGKKLLLNGVNIVELVAPDGIKLYFYGYINKATLDINGTKVNLIAPFSMDNIGKRKGYSFGVKPMHGGDSFCDRYVQRKLIELGVGYVATLDSWSTRGSMLNLVANLYYDALKILEGWFDSELTRIEALTGIKCDNRPEPRDTTKYPTKRSGLIF